MTEDDSELTSMSLAEERLRLEREALAVERERLASARAHAEAEARLAVKARHPFLVVVSIGLLALFCFLAGLLTGKAVEQSDQRKLREETLARALSQLNGLGAVKDAAGTNAAPASANGAERTPADAHRNVSVVVIQ